MDYHKHQHDIFAYCNSTGQVDYNPAGNPASLACTVAVAERTYETKEP